MPQVPEGSTPLPCNPVCDEYCELPTAAAEVGGDAGPPLPSWATGTWLPALEGSAYWVAVPAGAISLPLCLTLVFGAPA
ncbi:MAG: hypothetical protein M3308_09095, partial [Actinomycetota bacterium]|nr:hypothetical protein [Actinomycetota bacterium]